MSDQREGLDELAGNVARVLRHPSIRDLETLLRVDLPADLNLLFERTAAAYNLRGLGTAFDEAPKQRDGRLRMFELMNTGVQEGLRSAFYHLGRLQWLEHEVERLGEVVMEEVRPTRPTSLGLPSATLTSEYEAFTMMSRAALDRLSRFFATYFKTDARNLYKLKATLANNARSESRALRLIEAIDRHSAYLDTQISTDKLVRHTERDRLAHREYISFTTMNIIGGPNGAIDIIAASSGADGHLVEDPIGAQAGKFDHLMAAVIDMVSAFFGWESLAASLDAFAQAQREQRERELAKLGITR